MSVPQRSLEVLGNHCMAINMIILCITSLETDLIMRSFLFLMSCLFCLFSVDSAGGQYVAAEAMDGSGMSMSLIIHQPC